MVDPYLYDYGEACGVVGGGTQLTMDYWHDLWCRVFIVRQVRALST